VNTQDSNNTLAIEQHGNGYTITQSSTDPMFGKSLSSTIPVVLEDGILHTPADLAPTSFQLDSSSELIRSGNAQFKRLP
jgi:hypothetical protein